MIGFSGGDEFGAGELEKTDGGGEERFALEKGEEVAIKRSMDLESVAAVLDDVGIDEARDEALLEQSFGEASGEVVGVAGVKFFVSRHRQIGC